MNTTGMTEMGDPNNVPEKESLYQFMKRGFFSEKPFQPGTSFPTNRELEEKRRAQTMNNLRKPSSYREFTMKRDGEVVADKILDALVAAELEQNYKKNSYKQASKETKEQAIEALFLYLLKYQPQQGRSVRDQVSWFLDTTIDLYKSKQNLPNRAHLVYLLGNKFWGAILPENEEELQTLLEKYKPVFEKNFNKRANYSKNPMFKNVDGGRRRKTRRRTSRKSKTRKH
jgi:hypothetical protein